MDGMADIGAADCNRNAAPPMPPSTAWQSQRRMIFVRNVKGNVGHWPIPESFWPDANASKLVWVPSTFSCMFSK